MRRPAPNPAIRRWVPAGVAAAVLVAVVAASTSSGADNTKAAETTPVPVVQVTDTEALSTDAPPIVPPAPGSYTYQELIPCADPSYDMAMNILTAPPGGSIGLVEIHHQEHGLYMLEGEGLYYLAGDYHQVFAGDSIYMAPYCPQSFWATGMNGGSYLLYKDVNRHPDLVAR